MNKKAFEFSFTWFFAILVGAVILFLAIYGVVRLISTSQYQVTTTTAKQLTIIFEPMEIGLASGKSNIANFNEETRIFNKCYSYGNFGEHRISISTRSSFKEDWTKPSAEIPLSNKYIFSNSTIQAKQLSFFSVPFNFPWKISEIIILLDRNYCFMNAPEEIQNSLVGLSKNIKFENCSNKDLRVCFNSKSNCDIIVRGTCSQNCESDFDYGYVYKDGEEMFYSGNLIYASIFSSPSIYECNVKRLMKRLSLQAQLLEEESNFISSKCGSISTSSISLSSDSLSSSKDLLFIQDIARQLDNQNSASECTLW